jgi:phosphoglucosamine mutase
MLFGSSGIRRRYGPELVQIALMAGSALAARAGRVLVGMDTRTTSPVLANCLVGGALGSGASVAFCGIAPTPSIAYTTRSYGAGAIITASHNPEEYNGIKLFNPDGSSLTQAQQQELERRMAEFHWTDWRRQGAYEALDAISPHTRAILEKRGTCRSIHAVLDCGSGAGSVLSPGLLKEMGVSVSCVNCTPSGHFPRPSEPTEENLPYLGNMIRKRGADCAVAHDGDADRMVAFDREGRMISGDHLLILFIKYLGAKRVVTTVDASMAIDEVAEVRRTPVGDSYVSEALLSWGQLGGEPSGAWIFPEISCCPDGPHAAALFCEITSEWDLAEEIRGMPGYPILRQSFTCETAREIVAGLGAANPTDGIRESKEDGWYLIRASGTEPKIRITAEGKTLSTAKAMMEKGKKMMLQQMKQGR